MAALATELMNWSILGSGKLSLGVALFKSVKPMHILHFPFFRFDQHSVANHFGYMT
jgi:hypothetical protein